MKKKKYTVCAGPLIFLVRPRQVFQHFPLYPSFTRKKPTIYPHYKGRRPSGCGKFQAVYSPPSGEPVFFMYYKVPAKYFSSDGNKAHARTQFPSLKLVLDAGINEHSFPQLHRWRTIEKCQSYEGRAQQLSRFRVYEINARVCISLNYDCLQGRTRPFCMGHHLSSRLYMH